MDKWEYLVIEIEFEPMSKELDSKLQQEIQKRPGYGLSISRLQAANNLGLTLTHKIKHFDELGKQGWELVSIHDFGSRYAYFKRKIEEL